MSWNASLSLDYALEARRSVVRHAHSGPLRVLQSLYPQGDAVCHTVLVHPPGGLVGGDTLDMHVTVGNGAHALVTTPGATRFYRSEGALAVQRAHLRLEENARMEWLPLEAIFYSGCVAENRLCFELAPGAELMGWDVSALGLPHAKQPYASGSFRQHLELPGIWLERALIDAQDQRLWKSPVGLAGQHCVACFFFATGRPIQRERRDLALELTRQLLHGHTHGARAGVTCVNPQVLVLRVLTPQVEPAMDLLRKVWAVWRQALWQMPATTPRIWAM